MFHKNKDHPELKLPSVCHNMAHYEFIPQLTIKLF